MQGMSIPLDICLSVIHGIPYGLRQTDCDADAPHHHEEHEGEAHHQENQCPTCACHVAPCSVSPPLTISMRVSANTIAFAFATRIVYCSSPDSTGCASVSAAPAPLPVASS